MQPHLSGNSDRVHSSPRICPCSSAVADSNSTPSSTGSCPIRTVPTTEIARVIVAARRPAGTSRSLAADSESPDSDSQPPGPYAPPSAPPSTTDSSPTWCRQLPPLRSATYRPSSEWERRRPECAPHGWNRCTWRSIGRDSDRAYRRPWCTGSVCPVRFCNGWAVFGMFEFNIVNNIIYLDTSQQSDWISISCKNTHSLSYFRLDWFK